MGTWEGGVVNFDSLCLASFLARFSLVGVFYIKYKQENKPNKKSSMQKN